MSERWTVELSRRAERDLRRLDPPVRRRIVEGLDRLAAGELELRKVQGRDELRARIGDWRVRVTRAEGTRTLQVVRILPRGRAYDR